MLLMCLGKQSHPENLLMIVRRHNVALYSLLQYHYRKS